MKFSNGQRFVDATAAELVQDVEQRRHARKGVSWRARIASAHGVSECRVWDLSPCGLRLVMDEPICHDTFVSIRIEPFGQIRGAVVWQTHNLIGIAFFEEALWLPESLADADHS